MPERQQGATEETLLNYPVFDNLSLMRKMIPLKNGLLLIFVGHFGFYSFGQNILSNNCDSAILTEKELLKCRIDSVYIEDIFVRTNFISAFKTQLLPKYKPIRTSLSIPGELMLEVREFKKIYDSVLNQKVTLFEKEMDRNQLYVQPKAYINSILAFQLFKFFPDVYAILLNEIHLELKPRTTHQNFQKYKGMFEKMIQSIPPTLYQKLSEVTTKMQAEQARLPQKGMMWLFQGSIPEGYRQQCNIVNFLLWTE